MKKDLRGLTLTLYLFLTLSQNSWGKSLRGTNFYVRSKSCPSFEPSWALRLQCVEVLGLYQDDRAFLIDWPVCDDLTYQSFQILFTNTTEYAI